MVDSTSRASLPSTSSMRRDNVIRTVIVRSLAHGINISTQLFVSINSKKGQRG